MRHNGDMKTWIARTLLTLAIWLMTAVDIWCCQWLTPDGELNPVARYLLVQHGVWMLVALKVVGTSSVTETLRYLHIGYSVFIALFMLVVMLILGGVIPV
jgi:hypothetical protein